VSTILAFPQRNGPRQDGFTLETGSLERALEMAALREEGSSLNEIAAHFMVSRERVRQILLAHGGPDRREAAEARRRRAEQLAESRIDELLALWRTGGDPAGVGEQRGLQPSACRSVIERFATDVDRAARRASMADARVSATYSDSDIVLALRAVAQRLGDVPTGKQYAVLARGMRLPSLATVANRMGSWSDAVASAGLRPATVPGSYPRRWTSDACWEALRRAVEELGTVPSVLA